jgi:acetyl-CoA acetyltransferase
MHGIDAPGSATALVAQRYMDKYGANWEDLARIGIGYREIAAKNPIATVRNKPLTIDSYLQEPVIAGPFRRRDYSLTNEGSTCLIVTTTERARDLAKRPASISVHRRQSRTGSVRRCERTGSTRGRRASS